MNIFDLAVVLVICLTFVYTLHSIRRAEAGNDKKYFGLLEYFSLSTQKMQADFLKRISEVEKKHFEQGAKVAKEYTSGLTSLVEALAEKPQPLKTPDLLDKVVEENTIEKEDILEIPLDEAARIPLVDGVKLKFEDEEEIYPIEPIT